MNIGIGSSGSSLQSLLAMDCTSQNLISPKRFVLQVPSMLPDEARPYWGIFMRAHMESAISVQVPIVSYYGYSLPAEEFSKIKTETKTFENVPSKWGTYPEVRQKNRHQIGWQIIGFLKFYQWVKKHRKQIHLIHAHGVAWGGIWSIVAGRRFKIPVIVTEHSSAFPRNTHPGILKKLFRFVLPKADALLPVTKNLGGFLKNYAPKVPQYYVPNCVDARLFSPSPIPISQEPLKLLYVGSFVEVKHVDLLLKACAEVNKQTSIHLTLVGTGPLKNQLEKLSGELGIKENIRFAGHLPSEKVQEKMKNAHLLVLSSKWESQPCVLIEAMLSGRPVVAPDVGGVGEMITKESGELFEAENQGDLVRAINRVIDHISSYNPELISSECHEKHSFEKVGNQLKDIYTQFGGEICEQTNIDEEILPRNNNQKASVA